MSALQETSDVDEVTAQVLYLKGLESNPYLLYSVLHGWTRGTLTEMMQKARNVFTGVVHPMMMSAVPRAPIGATPMEMDSLKVELQALRSQLSASRSGREIQENPSRLLAIENPLPTGQDVNPALFHPPRQSGVQ